MTANVYSSFLQLREFDDSGKLLAAGTMEFYLAGTTTLGNVYSDAAGTPLVNPVVLNGAGTERIFGDAQAYRLVIRDQDGVLIYEIDNVYPFGQSASGTGAGTIGVALTYNGVRSLPADFDAVVVCGRDYPGDGGQGLFFRSTDTPADNDCTVLAHGATRYIRQYQGLVDPRWAGVVYSTPADQHTAFDAACAVGPVQIAGQIYIDQDYHCTGTFAVLSGGFYSSVTPKLYVEGKILQGAAGMFGSGIEVHFSKGVTDAIRSSWFAGGANQSLCTTYSYDYYFDAYTSVSADLVMPFNYRVDFRAGGMLLTQANVDISIANLVYSGSAQIIKYRSTADVGTVDFGSSYAMLEWFGGVAGYAFGVDNVTAGLAALKSGRVVLAAPYYQIKAAGASWSTGKALYIKSTVPGNTLDINQDVTVTELHVNDTTITGTATLTASGQAYIDHSSLLAVQYRASAVSGTPAVASYMAGSYTVAGTNGMLRRSADLNSWTAATGITDNLSSLAKGAVWVATGEAGRIWKSTDGGATWAAQTVGAATLTRAVYIKGAYILLGPNGQVYTSVDAVAWNSRPVGSASTLRDITFHPSTNLYVVVGTGAYLATSPDLITWTARPLPSQVINDLYTVVAGATGLVASGLLAGAYLRSTDAVTWTVANLPDTTTVYASAASNDTIVLTGANGVVYKSTNSGITFAQQTVAASVPLLCVSWSQGDWVLGAPNGVVYHSTDLIAFTSSFVGAANDVRAAYVSAPVYAIAGSGNSLQISADAVTWTQAVVDNTSYDWNNIRVINGLAWLCGDAGRLFATSDFVSYKAVPGLDASKDVHDIVWNTVASKYTVVGSSGYVVSAPDLFAAAPAWTPANASVTSATLTRAVWTGASYIFGGSNVVVTSPDALTLTLVSNVINGMVYTGSLYIQYGNSGVVLTSPSISGPWTKAISGTTYNLLAGIHQGGTTVLVGANGTCIKSTDGIAWASVSVGTTNQINAIAWNASTSKLGLVASSGKAYQSSDLGTTWTSMYAGALTVDFLGLWARGAEWNICGAGGTWIYSPDASTWTARTTGTAANLYDGTGNQCIGDSGTLLSVATGSVVSFTNVYSVGSVSFRNVLNNTILDSAGKLWNTDATFSFFAGTSTTVPGLRSLCYGAATLYAVGDSTWSSLDSTGHEVWVKVIAQYTSVNDLRWVSGTAYIVGAGGLYASSTNGQAWTYLGATTWVDTKTYYSVEAYQDGLPSVGLADVTAYTRGKYVVAIYTGLIYSGASTSLPVLVAGTINANYATGNTVWTSTAPGTISYSNLRSISSIGATNDSTFDRFAGSISGNVVRSRVSATQPVTVFGDVYVADSVLRKDVNLDPAGRVLIQLSGQNLSMSNTGIETNGALVYSSTSTTVTLNNCYNSGNFSMALSSGAAKVYLNNSKAVRNSTAYSIDGYTLDDSYTWAADSVLSAAATNWTGAVGSVTSNGTQLVVNSPLHLSSDYASANTLRYHLYDSVAHLGGRIKLEIQYPATAPNNVALKASVVHSSATGYKAAQGVVAVFCEAYECGSVTPWPASTANESVTTWCNFWAGYSRILTSDLHLYGNEPLKSMWGDTMETYAKSSYGNAAYLVITNAGTGAIPAGTLIKVSVVHSLPYTYEAYRRYFNDADTGSDHLQNLPRAALAFEGVDRTSREIRTKVQAGGNLATITQYLSQGTVPAGVDAWSTSGAPDVNYPTDKRKLFPLITKAQGVQRLRMHLQALRVLDSSVPNNWGGLSYSLSGTAGLYVPESYEISNDGWYLDTSFTPNSVTFLA